MLHYCTHIKVVNKYESFPTYCQENERLNSHALNKIKTVMLKC